MDQILIHDIILSFNKKKGRFLLSVEGQIIEQNVCEFLGTISFMVGTNVEEYLLSTETCYDTIRLPLTGSGKVITLNLTDFIRFREAYSQQMFLLKLEDLLMRKGIQSSRDL